LLLVTTRVPLALRTVFGTSTYPYPRCPTTPPARSRLPLAHPKTPSKPLGNVARCREIFLSQSQSLSLSLYRALTCARGTRSLSLAWDRLQAQQGKLTRSLSRSLALAPYRPVPQPISSLTHATTIDAVKSTVYDRDRG